VFDGRFFPAGGSSTLLLLAAETVFVCTKNNRSSRRQTAQRSLAVRDTHVWPAAGERGEYPAIKSGAYFYFFAFLYFFFYRYRDNRSRISRKYFYKIAVKSTQNASGD